MTTAATLQLHHREAFERNVTRALVAGAGAGLLALAATRLPVGWAPPIAYFPLAAAAIACVGGDRLDRWMLWALALVLPGLPWLFGLSASWALAFAGAGAGLLMVKARLAEKGEEGSLGAERPGAWHYGLSAAAAGGLALAGARVAEILQQQLLQAQAPAPLGWAVFGGVLALFAALGSLPAHLALKADPVEARGEELVPTLRGEFQTQASKALGLYRQCGEALAALPREPAREELARTVQRLTRDALELAGEWAGVEVHLEEGAQEGLAREVAELRASAQAAKDVVARRQLEVAAASLVEEQGRLEEMKLRRERVLAKLKSLVALLERARVSLIGMRSSQASVRASELSAVSRRLNALALAQADEARLAHAVATSAELAAEERAAEDSRLRDRLRSAGEGALAGAPARASAPAAVAPVTSDAPTEAPASTVRTPTGAGASASSEGGGSPVTTGARGGPGDTSP